MSTTENNPAEQLAEMVDAFSDAWLEVTERVTEVLVEAFEVIVRHVVDHRDELIAEAEFRAAIGELTPEQLEAIRQAVDYAVQHDETV